MTVAAVIFGRSWPRRPPGATVPRERSASAPPGVRDRADDITHSDYFTREFVERYWLPWFRSGTFVPSPWTAAQPPAPWWRSILTIVPLRWLLVALLLLGLTVLGRWCWRLALPPPAASAARTWLPCPARGHVAPDAVGHPEAVAGRSCRFQVICSAADTFLWLWSLGGGERSVVGSMMEAGARAGTPV